MNDLPAMKREISGLKDEIRKLGNVNVNAIEDYKNLMERYTFMKTQHDDLVEAEKTLEGIIEELDAALRWREGFIRHSPTVRNSEPEAVSVLSVRRDRGRTG